MDVALPVEGEASARMICSEDLGWALSRGWDDFKALRGDVLLLPIIYVVAGLAASFFAFNSNLFALIFPLAAGFALIGPAAATGFYELARRRAAGEDTSWRHFLDPLKGPSRLPMAMLTIMLVAIFIAWMFAADIIYRNTLGVIGPVSPDDFVRDLFGTPQGLALILIGNAVGAVFAVLTLAVAAFSFPMVVDKGGSATAAVATSVSVFRLNPVQMIGWGIRVAVLLAIAALPLFVGLIVALPVLGYATWHLYTRAVRR